MAQIINGKLVISDNEIKCSSCKIYKNKNEFGSNKSRKNGLNASCKVCNNLASAEVNKSKSKRRAQLNKALDKVNILIEKSEEKYVSQLDMIKNNINTVLENSKIYTRDVDKANEQIFEVLKYIKVSNEKWNEFRILG